MPGGPPHEAAADEEGDTPDVRGARPRQPRRRAAPSAPRAAGFRTGCHRQPAARATPSFVSRGLPGFLHSVAFRAQVLGGGAREGRLSRPLARRLSGWRQSTRGGSGADAAAATVAATAAVREGGRKLSFRVTLAVRSGAHVGRVEGLPGGRGGGGSRVGGARPARDGAGAAARAAPRCTGCMRAHGNVRARAPEGPEALLVGTLLSLARCVFFSGPVDGGAPPAGTRAPAGAGWGHTPPCARGARLGAWPATQATAHVREPVAVAAFRSRCKGANTPGETGGGAARAAALHAGRAARPRGRRDQRRARRVQNGRFWQARCLGSFGAGVAAARGAPRGF